MKRLRIFHDMFEKSIDLEEFSKKNWNSVFLSYEKKDFLRGNPFSKIIPNFLYKILLRLWSFVFNFLVEFIIIFAERSLDDTANIRKVHFRTMLKNYLFFQLSMVSKIYIYIFHQWSEAKGHYVTLQYVTLEGWAKILNTLDQTLLKRWKKYESPSRIFTSISKRT